MRYSLAVLLAGQALVAIVVAMWLTRDGCVQLASFPILICGIIALAEWSAGKQGCAIGVLVVGCIVGLLSCPILRLVLMLMWSDFRLD